MIVSVFLLLLLILLLCAQSQKPITFSTGSQRRRLLTSHARYCGTTTMNINRRHPNNNRQLRNIINVYRRSRYSKWHTASESAEFDSCYSPAIFRNLFLKSIFFLKLISKPKQQWLLAFDVQKTYLHLVKVIYIVSYALWRTDEENKRGEQQYYTESCEL